MENDWWLGRGMPIELSWYRKPSSEEVTWAWTQTMWRVEPCKNLGEGIPGREQTVSVKALKWEQVWCPGESAGRLVCLEWNESGGHWRRGARGLLGHCRGCGFYSAVLGSHRRVLSGGVMWSDFPFLFLKYVTFFFYSVFWNNYKFTGYYRNNVQKFHGPSLPQLLHF